MTTTINFLDDLNGLYSKSSKDLATPITELQTDWLVTNAVVSPIATEFISNSRFVLRIAPSGSLPVGINLQQFPIRESDNKKYLSFNAKIKTDAPCEVNCKIYGLGDTAPSGYTQSIPGGVYSAIQSNVYYFSDFSDIVIEITITGHQGQNIYFTYPNLIDDRAFYNNLFVGWFRSFMPDFYWEIDSQQSQPTAPFHRLIDILTSASDQVRKEYLEIYPYENNEVDTPADSAETWARSALVDPDMVKSKYAAWLAQFTGNSIKKNLNNGSQLFFQNELNVQEFIKWQLRSSHYGRAAGTREALINAARQVLIYTKDNEPTTLSVSLTPGYNNDSWTFLVRTLTNETPDANAGETSQLVLQAMEPARPMGYILLHTTVDDIEFTLNDLTFGRLNEITLGGVVAPTDAPQNITQSAIGTNFVTLAFDSMSIPGSGDGGGIISNYVYYLSTDGGSTYDGGTPLSPAKGSPPITITGLTTATNYYVKLRAVNEAGLGTVDSTPFSFTTL